MNKKRDKIYLDQNVYTATMDRLEFILDHFDNYYISFSGGKDSSITLQLLLKLAKEKNKLPVKVLFIDLEAQYSATIKHVEELLLIPEIKAYWICLPLTLRNAVSVFQPKWIAWNESKKDIWVRQMPNYDCVINLSTMPSEWKNWFYYGMEFEEFIIKFGMWFRTKSKIKTASIICIRSDESLNRFKAVTKQTDGMTYNNLNWTTIIRKNLINCYPIYDWKTEDIWTAVGKFNLKYNKIYDLIYMTGKSIHETRICQPYGDDQRKGLDLFRKVEPETWIKIINRVQGVNYGNIYCGTQLLGNGKIKKPSHFTWQEYTNFLLETIPKYQAHIYKERFDQFIEWWEKNYGIKKIDIPDSIPPKENKIWIKKDNILHKKVPSWERMAKTILKNDITCKSLSFGCVVGGYPRYLELKKKYGE